MNKRACKKCGLIQLHDELFGLAICDSVDAFILGCPSKEKVLEFRPDWEYDVTEIIPQPITRPFLYKSDDEEF